MTHELAAGEQRDLINKVIQKNVVFECDLHVVGTLMQRLIDGQNLREMSCMQVHARLQQVALQKYPPKKMRLVDTSRVPTKRPLKFIEVLAEEDRNGDCTTLKFNSFSSLTPLVLSL